MVTQKGGAAKDGKGKKAARERPISKKYSHYNTKDGKVIKTRRHCPRCGPGVFLADHKTRFYCGRCHYTEFVKK